MGGARLLTLSWLRHRDGHCWIAALPAGLPHGDGLADPLASGARLFEDGREVGPSHAPHAEIAAAGGGRFSHWGDPTADALAFFYERLVDRGILVCDDYGFETCPGARRAIDEFFADKSEPVLHLPTGQGVVIRAAG